MLTTISMILGVCGFVGMFVFLIIALVAKLRGKIGQGKRNLLIAGGCLVAFIIGMSIPTESSNVPEPKKEVAKEVAAKPEKSKEEKEAEKAKAEAKAKEEAELAKKKEAEEKAKAEAEAKRKAEEEKKAKEEAERKAAEEKKAKEEAEYNEQVTAYVDYYYEPMSNFQVVMQDFSDHFAQADSNPMIVLEDSFYYDAGVLIARMKKEIETMQNYPGEIPKGLEESHENLMKSMDLYESAANNLPDALASSLEGDTSKTLSVMDDMTNATIYMGKASDLMDEEAARIKAEL